MKKKKQYESLIKEIEEKLKKTREKGIKLDEEMRQQENFLHKKKEN